jgi:hypothetical protein
MMRAMNTPSLEWKLIEHTARKLGVGKKAVEKWRERGEVPGKWHIKLIRASDGLISIDAFDRYNEDASA